MIKDLLLPLSGCAADAAALDTAIVLAEHHQAHLAVLICIEIPVLVASEWGGIPPSVYTELHAAALSRAEALAEWARERLAHSRLAAEFRLVEVVMLPASRTAALHGRHADLVIIASPAGQEQRGTLLSLFADLLMDSGRPVLVVPEGEPLQWPVARAVIAWQPTREASRAVHDALPLLRRASQVDVLVVEPRVSEAGHGEQPGADLATHLARHGVQTRVVQQPALEQTIAASILRHTSETDAGLLVAGGYSRPRWREQILGGVTRELLSSATLPVLFSH